jgi:hypothetical protein
MVDNTSQNNEITEKQPRTYHDFNVRFSRYSEANHTFKVWVEGQTPGGAMRPDNAVQRTYDPNVFWDSPASGIGGLLDGLERRNLTREELFKLGMLLADLALPEGEVRQLFDKSLDAVRTSGQGLRVRLRIDPVALVHLPWEFMTLPQASGEPKDTDFLALRREVSIVRTDTVEAAHHALPNRAVARVVAVLSNPTDQRDLEVDEDKEAIHQAVQALNQAVGKDLIEVNWGKRPATRMALEQALDGGADIFHYGGHAIFDPIRKEGKIILERDDNKSDFYSSEQLAQLLRGAEVRLAVLGACETGRRDGQNVWSGVAPALTRENIPAVIANQFKIKDDNAILIASKIYHRVLAGYTVDEALYEARQAIYQHKDLINRDWGVPVLYLLDKSGVLFPSPKADAGHKPAEGPFVDVANTFGEVEGKVVDIEIGKVTRGHIRIRDAVDKVPKGGEFTSLKIDTLE